VPDLIFSTLSFPFKIGLINWVWWLMAIISATEAEIMRIAVTV
jgi:hypothetical protein